jgi:putative Mn2+ efflux pump MntP
MGFIELFFLAVGLSMDAFAVAICIGLSLAKFRLKNALIVGLYFGSFQAGMPLIGYFVARLFAEYIIAYDHWVAFGLLGFLGGKMIYDSFKKVDSSEKSNTCVICNDNSCKTCNNENILKFNNMLPLALATSVDALAVGVSLAFLQVSIIPAVSFIGIVTLVISMVGVKIGNIFGAKFKSKAQLVGGIILFLIGLRILLEHTGIINF